MAVSLIFLCIFCLLIIIILMLIFASIPISMQNDLNGTEGWWQRKPKRGCQSVKEKEGKE